ncbi:GntR family transcriptional regulator [Halalkalibacter hemicellulosilyticus]|uniref:Transcriptional regulator n=1 Tax=Halalkalibacter hemicellulosilyticusJCM 9152 TaxID=1236971 RepID=W4QMI2_9BACI|nr:GntR family transcriptional regulator [Halalkalibacter hemicellulosilyticus]GAE32853.1 transcriptional regulator [Halalkalibacter hemicellulosilyticusJCM 9152]
MINKNSPIPFYHQLEELIRHKIDTNELKEGDVIPSERALSEDYDVSRMTIRQALTNLVNEGLLTREKGKGTFVAKRKLEQPLMKLTSFSEDMKNRGLIPESRIIEFTEGVLSVSECKELQVPQKSVGYRINRLRLADNAPMAYEILVLPKVIFPQLSQESIHSSFYSYAEELGYQIDGATQTLEPSLAYEQESELLQIKKGSPVLLMKRVSRLADGRPFEYVKSIYRGDRYKFITELKR